MSIIIDLNVLPVVFLGFLDLTAILAAHWFRKKWLIYAGALVMFFLYVVALSLKG